MTVNQVIKLIESLKDYYPDPNRMGVCTYIILKIEEAIQKEKDTKPKQKPKQKKKLKKKLTKKTKTKNK